MTFPVAHYPLATVAIVSLLILAACNASPQKPDMVFDAGSLSDKQWEQANKECQFEAAKATASIRPGDPSGDKFRKICILCVETKGITFLGTEDKLARRKTWDIGAMSILQASHLASRGR